MATDLFGKYFNNPTKSYIYTNMKCNGASADEISFDIIGSDGVISDNESTLSKIDLQDVHVGLTQYTNDMKTIDPYGLIYIKGVAQGDSYTRKCFGKIVKKITDFENWEYNSALIISIKYLDSVGTKVVKLLTPIGSLDEDITVIEKCQELFDENKIPINISLNDGYLYFDVTQLGYDFWINDVILLHYTGDDSIENEYPEYFGICPDEEKTNKLGFGYDNEWAEATGYNTKGEIGTGNAYTDVLTENDYRNIYDNLPINSYSADDIVHENLRVNHLYEDLTKYIPAHKYRNGAMKGCIVVATYPIFNAENIPDTQRSLKIAHMVDRVEDYYTTPQNLYSGLPMYVRVVRDVVDSYYSQYEFDIFNKWNRSYTHINRHDSWIDPEEIPYIYDQRSDWTHSNVPNKYVLNSLYKDVSHYDAIGLYGYANYLTKHNGWSNMGQFYARTTVGDDVSENTRNLIPSLIIYNPNSFPVIVKYMTFV